MPKEKTLPKKITWWNLTKKYKKNQAIFYLLTIASAFFAAIIDQNSIGNLAEKIRGGQWNPEFKIFSRVIIGKRGWLGNWFQGKWGSFNFQFFMLFLTVFYCLVVIAHVFYSYYFNNKINRFLRTQLMKKFFRLRGFYDKKTVLNIFNNDIRYLTGSREGIIVFPNQVFYLVVGIILNLLSIAISTKEEPNPNYNPIWVGSCYSLFILGVAILLEYALYWADLKFQKKSAQQTREEDIIINNRELIIKKGLTNDIRNTYKKIVDWTQDEADRRDWVYTCSWVIPAFSLISYYDFFSLLFLYGTGSSTLLASKLFGKIFGGIKKMVERLRDYPYYLSAAKRINEFLTQEERDDKQKNIFISEPIKSLNFAKVVFGYEKDKSVFNGLDLRFQKGKINYLRGENGFGKSTLINLLFGLYQLWEGEIWINDQYQLSEINLLDWRKKIAYAEHQNLVENGLSTGQKQLVDIYTTLAQNSHKEILIFDEADNALDEKNKKEFRKKLISISKEKLVILISH